MLGHNDFIFWNPTIMRHYLAAMQYVIGDLPAEGALGDWQSPGRNDYSGTHGF